MLRVHWDSTETPSGRDIWRLGKVQSDWRELANLPRLLSEKGLMIWWPHPASRGNSTTRQSSPRISISSILLWSKLRDGRKCLIVITHLVRLEAIFPPQCEAIRRMYSTWLILNIQLRPKHTIANPDPPLELAALSVPSTEYWGKK